METSSCKNLKEIIEFYKKDPRFKELPESCPGFGGYGGVMYDLILTLQSKNLDITHTSDIFCGSVVDEELEIKNKERKKSLKFKSSYNSQDKIKKIIDYIDRTAEV